MGPARWLLPVGSPPCASQGFVSLSLDSTHNCNAMATSLFPHTYLLTVSIQFQRNSACSVPGSAFAGMRQSGIPGIPRVILLNRLPVAECEARPRTHGVGAPPERFLNGSRWTRRGQAEEALLPPVASLRRNPGAPYLIGVTVRESSTVCPDPLMETATGERCLQTLTLTPGSTSRRFGLR